MSIFEKKLAKTSKAVLPTNPVDLFDRLFHQDGYGYLRGVQEEILKEWDKIRGQRDVIGKMNTGAGKTLTGLMMLYSKLVEGIGPVVYLCPDNQLVSQTIDQAQKYGVPVCTFQQGERFPLKFINKEAVLVCTFDKLFNGRSIFVEDNIDLGAVLLDDAHACVNKARDNSTIRVSVEHELFSRLLLLFEDDLKLQNAGTYAMLKDGDPGQEMRVPYWAWMNKHDTLINIINEYREDDEIKFPWRLIRDELMQCDCFFSSKGLEISPIQVPYYLNTSFNEAKHRYILSATFEDNTYLLRDLGLSRESIENPLTPKDRKDIGERLILAPLRYDPKFTDDAMRKLIFNYAQHNFNVVVLVPSRYMAKKWTDLGATYVDKNYNGLRKSDSKKGVS